MTRLILSALVAMALHAVPALAEDFAAGDMMVHKPWSRPTPAGATVGGGYLTLMNHGSAADRLVSVEAPFAEKAEIHESLTEDGVAKMREITGGVEVKPGATVEFKPGGKHVMFIGLRSPMAQGETRKVALVFEKAGRLEVEFAVGSAGAQPAAGTTDHKGH
jgi:copper(I)-binding protein